ncbi:hypothetical protein HOD20_10180 [archaeon]|nr:hypothetical protein [archaeon]MBT4352878.1 hypothetical protein [archaeon]MBT6820803.1 hypothetical protein [archaeon]MBT7391522.1 hypothetical protein [archaeon]
MNKKAQNMSWETIIKSILILIVLAAALNFCRIAYRAYDISKEGIGNEQRRTLSMIHQTIKHLDPDFSPSKKILIKTNDFTIKGFNDGEFCTKPCVCLCTDDYCDNLRVNPYDFCKELPVGYKFKNDFFIDKTPDYRRMEIKLEKESTDYLISIGTQEDA